MWSSEERHLLSKHRPMPGRTWKSNKLTLHVFPNAPAGHATFISCFWHHHRHGHNNSNCNCIFFKQIETQWHISEKNDGRKEWATLKESVCINNLIKKGRKGGVWMFCVWACDFPKDANMSDFRVKAFTPPLTFKEILNLASLFFFNIAKHVQSKIMCNNV